MRVEYTNSNGVFTAYLYEKLTFSDHGTFRHLLDNIRSSDISQCVIDVAKLDLIDSSGLGMIMLVIDESRKGKWSLTVKNAQGPVRQLLQLSKLDRLLTVA